MSTINLAHERFIREMILHGDRVKAYRAAYPSCSEKTAAVNACRLLARPEIKERIRNAVKLVQKKVESDLYEELKDKVLSTAHQRHLLYLIATGQQKTTKTIVRYNRPISWQQGPSIRDTLVALGLDYKLSNGWKRDVVDDDVVGEEN
ncbi:MAG: Terminase small subunit [Flavipsychrobacter sp.]|jgi:hypothetical protein|nr:Terminase small subunit [Flavipsychrobacter sp.]